MKIDTSKNIKIYVLVSGCGFPNFMGTSILVQIDEQNILIDTSTTMARDKLISQLHKLDLECTDIQHVIFTHMHMDHYGNIDLFQNARIYTTFAEYEFFKILHENKRKQGRDFIVNIWKGLENWKPFSESSQLLNNEESLYNSIKDLSPEQEKNLVFVEKGDVLFECLEIFRCYGHSVDHIGIRLFYNNQYVVIAGDIIPNKRCLERLLSATATTNVSQMFDELNYKIVKELGTIIIPGHDRPFSIESFTYVPHFNL